MTSLILITILILIYFFFFIYDEFERGEKNSSKHNNKKRKLSFATIEITKMINFSVKMLNLKIGVRWWWYFAIILPRWWWYFAIILPKNICQLERETFFSLVLYF
jgi:hypothetical protein